MQIKQSLEWAKSLLSAAIFASLIASTNAALANDDRSISGFGDTAGAYLDVGTYRTVKLIVYKTDTGEVGAVTFFQVGGRTFGYSPRDGSRFCELPLNASDRALAGIWCHRPIRLATERTRAAVLAEGYGSKQGDYPNGCLVDSLLSFERVARTKADANWEGLFVLLRGTNEFGGGHAVCIYLVGRAAWVYDPIGRQVSFLGPIDIQSSATIARKLDPQATGGWVESRDLAWLRRHSHALAAAQAN